MMENILPEVLELSNMIAAHQTACRKINYLMSDDEAARAMGEAEETYNQILDFKITALAVGQEKARYLLRRFDVDRPQEDQIRRLLQSMI